MQYDSNHFLDKIEQNIPLLTILVPDWSWVGEGCFSVKNWDIDLKDVSVSYDKDGSHLIFYNGELKKEISEIVFPEFPVLILKENERMIVKSFPTKGSDGIFDFADDSFNGKQTKGHGTVNEVFNIPYTATNNMLPLSELTGRVAGAYQECQMNSLLTNRDYIYYGMTSAVNTGYINPNYVESIRYIKLDPNNAGFFDDSQDFTGHSEWWNNSNHNPINRNYLTQDQIAAKIWGDGAIELRINVCLGTETHQRIISCPFSTAFTVATVYQTREENWLGATMWRHYYPDMSSLKAKWIYINQDFFCWDLTKYPEGYYIYVEEYDPSSSIETTITKTNTYAKNFQNSLSGGAGSGGFSLKIGYEYGSSTTEQRQESFEITTEQSSDALGSCWVHYKDPIVIGVSSGSASMNVYSTGAVDFIIAPKYLLQ